MGPVKCLLGRHDWPSDYDYAAQRVTWSCRRCGRLRLRATGPEACSISGPLGGG
jgi:hypothetical protein